MPGPKTAPQKAIEWVRRDMGGPRAGALEAAAAVGVAGPGLNYLLGGLVVALLPIETPFPWGNPEGWATVLEWAPEVLGGGLTIFVAWLWARARVAVR